VTEELDVAEDLNRRATDNRSYDAKMYYLLRLLAFVTGAVVLFSFALVGFWLLYPYKPIETFPKPYKIVYPPSRVVKQGEFITYEFQYNKTSPIIPVVTRKFVDGLIFNVSGVQYPTVTEEGTGTARAQVDIPETLPPGKYHLQIEAVYQMNPVRQYHNDSVTETFEVISGSKTIEEQRALQQNDKDASQTVE
jgi:hypothetical protein